MTKILSSYSFLPWLRIGIANQIDKADHDTSVKLRAPITVSLNIKADDEVVSPPVDRDVGLYGPGDIVGIDSKVIIKTEPLNWITNFEPNYLASIDFYEEDFPWRYTPAAPDNNDRLRPWVTLLVLKENEFEEGKNMADRPLPYIDIKSPAAEIFPPADQLWAWAHVHVNADLIEDDQTDPDDSSKTIQRITSKGAGSQILDKIKKEYEEIYENNPDAAYSRILCPRRLEPNTAYHAFLIPTYESGRLAGLGLKVEDIFNAESALHATFSAWGDYSSKTEPNYFPVYHRWYFRTGTVGDFEYLVRLLEPKPVDNRVGRRDMDVTEPGSNIHGITDDPENGASVPQLEGILRLGGALRIPIDSMKPEDKDEYQKYNQWATPYPRKFQKELAAFVNLADDYSEKSPKVVHQNTDLPEEIRTESSEENEPDPLITSPLYGRWHALTNRLLDSSDGIPDTNWIHELNLDPRYRVPAGFGTGVVQKNQEKYMESAWEQVGDVIEANRQIRQAQLAQAVSKYWFTNHIQTMQNANPGAFIWLTQPMHTRILSTGLNLEGKEEVLTVHHHVKTSKVPAAAVSPSMRKFTRPRGRLVRALPFDQDALSEHKLVDRINKDEVKPAPDKKIPDGLPTLDQVVESLKPNKVPGFFLKWMEKFSWLKFAILGAAAIILILLAIFVSPDLGSITPGTGSISGIAMLIAIFLIYLFVKMLRWQKQLDSANNLSEEHQTPEAVDDLPKWSDFRLTRPGEDITFSKGSTDSDEGARFKEALKDVGEVVQAHREASKEPVKPVLDLDTIMTATLQTIDPIKTIPGFILNNKVRIPDRIRAEFPEEVFQEAMAYPEFDTPMYKPLLDISEDLFLPNINHIDQNSISLLETNQKFIEAYMVGLNHEFARELLWREYPTDQRGSYFRQFWDVSDFMFEQTVLDDIRTEVIQDLGADADEEAIQKRVNEKVKEKLKDIPKLHRWSKFSNLGSHDHRDPPGEDEVEVVLVIRGELLKKYPNAVIYAHRAKWKPVSGGDPTPDKKQERELVHLNLQEGENPPIDTVKTPLYEAKADPDIYFFGFNLNVSEVQGLTEGEPANLEDRAGWFFVIKERPGEPRFGLDIGETEAGEIEVWNDMAWGNVTPEVEAEQTSKRFLQITPGTAEIDVEDNPLEPDDDEKKAQRVEDEQIKWNEDMNSAELAYILFQAPVMVAVHGAEMLPKP